jgi:low affinity Fe/Cu permease
MSLLWAVPPVAVAAAVVIVLLQLRDIAEATADLNAQLRRLDEVRLTVATVRAESAEARASLRSLRSR